MSETTVMQAKRYGIVSCTADAPLLVVAKRMAEEDVSALVVVDQGGCLAGIITRIDLLRADAESPEWATRPVEMYMNREVVTVGLQTSLNQVAALLLDKRIHRVVVVREEGEKPRPVAVVSAADLIYHMVREHGQTGRDRNPRISTLE